MATAGILEMDWYRYLVVVNREYSSCMLVLGCGHATRKESSVPVACILHIILPADAEINPESIRHAALASRARIDQQENSWRHTQYMSCGLVYASRLCFFPFSTDSKTPIRELCERGKSIMKDQTQSICISDLLTWPKSADTDRPLQETRLQQQHASKQALAASNNE